MSGCFVRVRLLPAVPRACRALLFSNCIKQAGYPATNARTRNKQSWAASCCLGENQQRLLHAASTAGGGVEVGTLSSGARLICFVGGSSAPSAVSLCVHLRVVLCLCVQRPNSPRVGSGSAGESSCMLYFDHVYAGFADCDPYRYLPNFLFN